MPTPEDFKNLIDNDETFRTRFNSLDTEKQRKFIKSYLGKGEEAEQVDSRSGATGDFSSPFSKEEMASNPLLQKQSIQQAEQRTIDRPGIDIGSSIDKAIKLQPDGILEIASAPFDYTVSLATQLPLSAQRGDTWDRTWNNVISAVKGQRISKPSDLFVGAGMDPQVAEIAGLGVDLAVGSMAVAKVWQGVSFAGRAAKDAKAVKATQKMIDGARKMKESSRLMANKYWKQIDNIVVSDESALRTVDSLSKLPKTAIKFIEKETGRNVEQITKLSHLREVKQALGYLNTGWSKAARGVSESLKGKDIRSTYREVSKILDASLRGTPGITESIANKLVKVNQASEKTINASNYLLRTLQTTEKIPKVGSALKVATDLQEAGLRHSIRKIPSAKGMREAKNMFNSGSKLLREIASSEARLHLGKRIMDAAVLGAVGGGMIGGFRRSGESFFGGD